MRGKKIGKLPKRYTLLMNPHSETRLSTCPECNRPTHPRKFALFIHVEGWGPLVLGKTCKYCSRCEMVMIQQEELEGELTVQFTTLKPDVIGNDYFVLGTVEKKVWQRGLKNQGGEFGEILDHLADFKKELVLEYDPGGWKPADEA